MCQGDAEYHCRYCCHNLCPQCKRTHSINLDTKNHDVTLYREKFNSLFNSEICDAHPEQVYEMHCETCDLPVCFLCNEHKLHKLKDIRTVYQDKRTQNEERMKNIRSETLYNAKALRQKIKSEVTICKKEMIPNTYKKIMEKSEKLKNLMDTVSKELSVEYKLLLNQRTLKQIVQMQQHIDRILIYEHKYEHYANRPVQFLRFIKRSLLTPIQNALRLKQQGFFSLTQKINMKDLKNVLSEIQLIRKGKRQAEFDLLLKLMPFPSHRALHKIRIGSYCRHISYVTPDKVWVSDLKNLLLKDICAYKVLNHVNDSLLSVCGSHTVNKEGDMIYVDNEKNINIFSKKQTSTIIDKGELTGEPRCVYYSWSSGDLLVGMTHRYTNTGHVTRYNTYGRITQIIPRQLQDFLLYPKSRIYPDSRIYVNSGLYHDPRFITENRNGDVVVSDFKLAVVVTSRDGKHRFSYEKPPSGSRIDARGICTDALSHILLCDAKTDTVQMIDKDGQFLSYLIIGKYSMCPRCVSYDFERHLLWVGSGIECMVSVYRYINRKRVLTGKYHYLLIIILILNNDVIHYLSRYYFAFLGQATCVKRSYHQTNKNYDTFYDR